MKGKRTGVVLLFELVAGRGRRRHQAARRHHRTGRRRRLAAAGARIRLDALRVAADLDAADAGRRRRRR